MGLQEALAMPAESTRTWPSAAGGVSSLSLFAVFVKWILAPLRCSSAFALSSLLWTLQCVVYHCPAQGEPLWCV